MDAAVIAARRDRTVARLVKGLHSLIKKNGVTYVRGRGRLEGPQQVRVSTVDDAGSSSGEVILTAKDVILATGSRVKSLPGLVPDGDAHRHQRRRAALRRTCPARSSSSAPAPWASSSPATTTTSAAR